MERGGQNNKIHKEVDIGNRGRHGGGMAGLIGDKRKFGQYYALLRTLLMNDKIGQLKGIIIKIQHNCRSDRATYEQSNPFLIPIKHEYCLIFQKG